MILRVAISLSLWAVTAFSATGADTWLQNGKPVADTDSRKSHAGFGAQLLLTESEAFFENWNEPQEPRLPQFEHARRGVPIFTAIIFVDPALDSRGRALVTCDVTIRRPDGTVYGEGELEGWNGKYAVPRRSLQLAVGRMGIVIEPDDPAGLYKVEAVVRDHHRKVSLPLKATFVVKQ